MASTNTSLLALDNALSALPATFRSRLVTTYRELKLAWTARQWDACGIRAGKFCEVLLRYVTAELTGTYVPFGAPLSNVADACRKLEALPKTAGPDSFRMLIPRCISFVYTLRNKRDVGHVGGDVDANEIDAACVIRCVDWCLSELIRVVHALSFEEAQDLLDSIAVRELPMVWAVGGVKRVLHPKLSRSQQTLILLYSDRDSAVLVEDLASWVEAPQLGVFKRDVLRPLHKKRHIELDIETGTVALSPTGAEVAEAILSSVRVD